MSFSPSRIVHRLSWRNAFSATLLLVLAACSTTHPPVPSPQKPTTPAASDGQVIEQKVARWVGVSWADLPGWDQDPVSQVWPALLRSCVKPHTGWITVCQQAQSLGRDVTDAQVRQWITANFKPYRIESYDGDVTGKLTGYYEPQLKASRTAVGEFTIPIYRPPADLRQRVPWFTRAQIQTEPQAQAALNGHEIAWLADPVDSVFLQVQGSGRLSVVDRNGQTVETIRVGFAGHNGHPFKPLSAWLVSQGELKQNQASGDGIRAWAKANPQRVNDLVNANPRVVFFQESPLLDPDTGPAGAEGVPLTPGRSLAVDRDAIPLGTLLWMDSTEPQKWSGRPASPDRPLQRAVVAQDTGSAIKGAVRADYFWGWVDGSGTLAGRTNQTLRLWALWPLR